MFLLNVGDINKEETKMNQKLKDKLNLEIDKLEDKSKFEYYCIKFRWQLGIFGIIISAAVVGWGLVILSIIGFHKKSRIVERLKKKYPQYCEDTEFNKNLILKD